MSPQYSATSCFASSDSVDSAPTYALRGDVYKRQALNPDKLRTGNRFSALHASKSLTEEERLRLTVEKLQIENERLKKGYIVKGVGASKEFVTLRDLNSR